MHRYSAIRCLSVGIKTEFLSFACLFLISGQIVYGVHRQVGLITSIFVCLLIIIVIAIGLFLFMRRRRVKKQYDHKKFGQDIVKRSPKRGKSDSPVMFSGGDYVKINKQSGDKGDTEHILGDDLNDDQL